MTSLSSKVTPKSFYWVVENSFSLLPCVDDLFFSSSRFSVHSKIRVFLRPY